MTRRALVELLRKQRPEISDPLTAISAGEVRVDGVIVTNPNSQVRTDAAIVVKPAKELKGEAKLAAGLDALRDPVIVAHAVCLDVGASTGGFTTELLRRGARVVYAVDAGHGQLMGSLRQHPQVRNLEATNASALDRTVVPDPLDVVTVDVSYSPLRVIVPDVTAKLAWSRGATMVALVKPMFELQAASLPTAKSELTRALDGAQEAVTSAGWRVDQAVESPRRGSAGAVEFFIRATLV